MFKNSSKAALLFPILKLNPHYQNLEASRRSRRRGRVRGRISPLARGMSLIEIMIVVAIIAMVSGAVAVAAVRTSARAKLSTAATGARTIRGAVQTYRISEVTSECPSASELLSLRYLDEGNSTKDPWGSDYRIDCEEDRVMVTSFGPDRRESDDDISVPPRKSGD